MPRLLLLDGHSLAYRAFFALPVENFSTTTGQHTNAVYGFTSMLINVLRDEAPTHVGVAFDVSRKTFRAAEYPEYKAGRSATPTEFSGQLPLLREKPAAARDLKRIDAMWDEALEASGGPFLFGGFSIADAYFAPVCTRVRTYGLPLSSRSAAYQKHILTLPAFLAWEREALAEHDWIPEDEPYRQRA